MKTVLMAIAIVKKEERILLRKTDPAKNLYKEPWALFGGTIQGEGTVQELLSAELVRRWGFSITIAERLWWDEEIKVDHDGEKKRFIYIDTICSVADGSPTPTNPNEQLEWVSISDLSTCELNPPTATLLRRLKYL